MVISDIRMPDMNGYEFMKKLRQIKTEVKVTLTTAFEKVRWSNHRLWIIVAY
ncbi:MAG: response regulator [Nitrososphaeraceae archaeon]